MENKYYLTQRGPGPGCQPKKSCITCDYGIKKYVEEIGCKAWGYAEYGKPLTKKEINDYELVEYKEKLPFTDEKVECSELCKDYYYDENKGECIFKRMCMIGELPIRK